jgi:hypothetical protein
MNILSRKNATLAVVTLVLVFATHGSAAAPVPPTPVLYFLGAEYAQVNGKQITRYRFDVLNKDQYPDDMFAQSPDLPPCGANTKAARTWIDIYDQSGKRLNGFCALGKSGDLNGLWFALDTDVIPPSYIYIELNDRKTNTKYKSNLSETTF